MATVSVDSVTIQNWQDKRTSVELLIFCSPGFIGSDTVPIPSGSINDKVVYKRVPCTVNTTAKTLTIASFTIMSTVDGIGIQSATYNAWFFAVNGDKIGARIKAYDGFGEFRVNTTTPQNWVNIAEYNDNRTDILQNNNAYTKDQSDSRYALASVTLNAARTNAENTFTQNNTFTDALLLQSIGGGDPLLPPNLVGAQTVKFGSSAIINDSGSGDYRQISAHVINSGTRNIVAGSFGARADGAGNAWGINPWGYANASGATGIAIENNFAVLASGGHAFGEVFVVVGNFDADAFLRFQTGVSGINTVNGIEVNRGAIGYEPISGSFLTFLGSPTMATGFDFSGGIFTTAPFLLGNNQFVKAKNTSGTGKIAGGCDGFDYMLFQSPGAGVRFINSANTAEIFKVKDEGILELTQITAPSGSPSAGTFWIFMDVADGKLKAKGALGTLTSLANP